MSVFMKCPKCGSKEILCQVIARGTAYVDMQTGELREDPEDCEFDYGDLDDFYCEDCEHEWYGEVPKGLFEKWGDGK